MAHDNDEAMRAMRLAARLAPYPELRARVEEILSVVENEQGDTFTADEAEERAFAQVLVGVALRELHRGSDAWLSETHSYIIIAADSPHFFSPYMRISS